MKRVTWTQAITLLITMGLLVLIFFGFLGLPLHLPLMFLIFISAGLALANGFSWEQVEKMLVQGFNRASSIIIILLLIGCLIGIWMSSGTIPTIIYYGLNLISPRFFYLISFLLCSLVSFAMGTGIGTLSTVGLALFSIGLSLSLPLPVVAGAIVSGSYFGDRFSPLSSIAIFTAHSAEVEVREMLIKMLGTTIPAFLLTGLAYFFLGTGLKTHVVTGELPLLSLIKENFPVSPLAFLPPCVIIVAAFMKMPTIPNLASGLILSLIIGVILAPGKITGLLESIYQGVEMNTAHETFNELFSRGGMVDLLDLIALIILAAVLAGLLEHLGIFHLLLEKLIKKADHLLKLNAITAVSGILMAVISCNQLLAVLLPGRIFLPPFEKAGEKALLARTLADTGLVFSPLIPWNINGILIVGVLGVNVLDFFPYAFLNWLLPIFTLILPWLAYNYRKLSPHNK